MIVDHVGVFFFPEELTFRIIGRLSFPLFAWLIANGARHTKDIKAYLKRLFLFAVISQIPYHLAFGLVRDSYVGLNIGFTLFLGILGIKLVSSKKGEGLKIAGVALLAVLAQILGSDYGAAGVLSIIFFYIFYDNFKLLILSQIFVYTIVWYATEPIKMGGIFRASPIQPIALFSLALISLYNGKLGPKCKYLFYLVYPLHLLILYIVMR